MKRTLLSIFAALLSLPASAEWENTPYGKLAPLHLFRTDDALPDSTLDTGNHEKPDFEEDSLIWKTAKD